MYGEALLIVLFKENAQEEVLPQYKIQPEQIRDFTKYTSKFEDLNGKSQALKDSFETSYLVLLLFCTMQEEKNEAKFFDISYCSTIFYEKTEKLA